MAGQSQIYCRQVTEGRWMDWSAASGVAVSRIRGAAEGTIATLSAPEMRDLIAAAALLSYTISTTVKNNAVTENAGLPHPSAKKVSFNLMSENLY